MQTISIPDKITIEGNQYKVTTIQAESFGWCDKHLKKIILGQNITTWIDSYLPQWTNLDTIVIKSKN